MKKRLLTALCLFALMATSTFVMAQEITITLNPGWTWISYTRADTLTFAEALGYFTPMEGDMINSQEHGSAVYRSGRWRGALQQFTPGVGYMYNSKRTESVSFVYTHAYQPEVNTLAVLGITSTSATVGGNLLNDGGATMRQCGICWGTNENPTINNSIASIGELTLGEYALELTNLVPGTTYHARAFATNSVGTSYGEDVTFTTQFVLPTVTTDEASWVTTTTAIVGGQFAFVGNCFVTECGVCYRTGEGAETCVASTTNTSPFLMELTDLLPNTTYIVRAYATNGAGTAYGEEKTFTTLEEPPAFPDGAINSLFTVNAYGGQVYFSQGNLQYKASTNTWRFAEYQWDYVGTQTPDNNGYYGGTVIGSDNKNISGTYNGWIDLFGWGTGNNPTNSTPSSSVYSSFTDWGNNSIINGGNQENSGWRTPTNEEWNYIINDRVTASGIRYAKAVVNDVKGVVVLPDNWLESTYTLNNTNSNNSDFNSNIINAEEWTNTLESNGAVFLPAAGYRYSNVQVYYAGGRGFYWSASYDSWDKAYSLNFSINSVNANSNNARFDGHSVRLVRYAE